MPKEGAPICTFPEQWHLGIQAQWPQSHQQMSLHTWSISLQQPVGAEQLQKGVRELVLGSLWMDGCVGRMTPSF